ncbi:hypothetical protein PPYR_02969 [Photinus pyralis]|uniref:RRM domain-containing protein n=1 Tax=Photinus pyralis TaxID=7054 RepID=A0A1Y1NHT1_PHOPY|nr:sex-lethal homolog [Photinus pyralis]KAB0791169.1 hypothetical protein PPYR_02969 [Photinus pyralis]
MHQQTNAHFYKEIGTPQPRQYEQVGGGDSVEAGVDKTKLIVNYIPQYTAEGELTSIFGNVGPLENVRIMRDHRTGYSYGFGFVKYMNAEDAARAIEILNGFKLRNKRLKVSYSRPPGQDMKYSNLYITNLPKNVTEEDMDNLFGEFGEIIQRTVLKDKITGMPRGVGFVRFSKTEEAQSAIAALNGKQLENAMLPLSIRVAEDHGKQKAHFLEHVNYGCTMTGGGKRRLESYDSDQYDNWLLENY